MINKHLMNFNLMREDMNRVVINLTELKKDLLKQIELASNDIIESDLSELLDREVTQYYEREAAGKAGADHYKDHPDSYIENLDAFRDLIDEVIREKYE